MNSCKSSSFTTNGCPANSVCGEFWGKLLQKIHWTNLSLSHSQVSTPHVCPQSLLPTWKISWQIWLADSCLPKWSNVVCFLFILQVNSPNIPPASGSFILINVWCPERWASQGDAVAFWLDSPPSFSTWRSHLISLTYISQPGEPQQQTVAQGA